MFYRPDEKSVCADVIPFYADGEFKLFYLRDYRGSAGRGEGCDWNLLTTKDLVHYTDHGAALTRGTEEDQDLYVFTGCCIRAGDGYMIFYTGHNPHKRRAGLPEQVILRATSSDLEHWEKDPDFRFAAPEWLEMHDFRDPFVFWDEENNRYAMLLAGRKKSDAPANTRGVTLVAFSEDLDHWEVSEEPFFEPEAYFAHECPDLFRMGDWWYLLFSEFSDRQVTTYRMSRSPFGPWITPRVNTFDGHAYYAAKSTTDGIRRILFGWNPIRDHERDFDCWQWGGNIIPHELVQQPDGTLTVRCPDEVRGNYGEPLPLAETNRSGCVKAVEGGYRLGDGSARSIVLLGEIPTSARIDLTVIPNDETGDFGVILHADPQMDSWYTVRFEPLFRRLTFDRWPRKDTAVHSAVDVERPCALKIGGENRVTILVQDSVAEVYVNDEVAMGVRMFDLRGAFGVYTMNTSAEFRDISVRPSLEP